MKTLSASQLPALLTHEAKWKLQLDLMRSNELTTAARFWFPPKPPTIKAECQAALTRLFANPAEMAPRLATLPASEQKVLAVLKRYDGAVSGTILRTELLTRKVITLPATQSSYGGYQLIRDAPYSGLVNKYIVATTNRHKSYYSSGSRVLYLDLVANPAALESITAAGPAPWQPDCSTLAPTPVTRGSFTEVVLNLWTVAQELDRNNGWKPTLAGNVPKTIMNKLRKVLPADPPGPPPIPDLPGLYCELLKGLGVITTTKAEGRVDLARLQEMLGAETEPLAFVLTGAWRFLESWQDGIGTLNVHEAEVRSETLNDTRDLLAWGLGTLARDEDGWFDLESFLTELWDIQQNDTPHFYADGYVWVPEFTRLQPKDKHTGVERFRSIWLSATGICCANAILGTLVHLGLVERGPITDTGPLAFRPTPLGRAVFGAPEVLPVTPSTTETPFFTIQPNFEVVAFIDDVPTHAVLPLAQLARRTSGSGTQVQTFVIDRESVYQAMEGGFSLDEIREYLHSYARNTPSPNVIRTLEEWGGKRDALTLRRGVSLLVGATSPPKGARAVGEGFHLLNGSTSTPKGVPSVTYPDSARPCGEADEYGVLRLDSDADIVAVARLRQLADTVGDKELHVTEASLASAKRLGISAEQLLIRLRHHHRGPLPALLEVAIQNWSGGGQVELATQLMLRVPDAIVASALLQSERFKPFLIRHIPPEWFVVDSKRSKELEKLLTGIGYNC